MTLGSLPTLLSRTYVAYTIEFDNRWEERLRGYGAAPKFLVSYVMWVNFMRFVGLQGIAVDDLEARCGPWNGPIHRGRMEEWWGYVTTSGDVVRPTLSGEAAVKAWDGLVDEIDASWRARFGQRRFNALTSALERIEQGLDLDLPDAMPVLNYADGYRTPQPEGGPRSPADHRPIGTGALLARVLLALTLEVEAKTRLSLPIAACALRLISSEPHLVKELPVLAGITKEAMKPALNYLAKHGYVQTESSGAKMTARLSPTGHEALDEVTNAARTVERAWRKRFGADDVDALQTALEGLYDEGDDGPLMRGALVTPEHGWRGTKPWNALSEAFATDPAGSLPHHPMLTHRGGWPDGS